MVHDSSSTSAATIVPQIQNNQVFSPCNFQSYSLLESRYSQNQFFNRLVSIGNVSWMCPCRRNSGVKSASFVTYTNTKIQTKQDTKNSQFQPENTSRDCKLRPNSEGAARERGARSMLRGRNLIAA